MRTQRHTKMVGLVGVLASCVALSGCQSRGQTGALVGAGIGALVGQAIGGDTGGTLVGAAVGSGVGYVIGNEQDKQEAREMSRGSSSETFPVHNDVGVLGGTRWMVESVTPRDYVDPFTSKIVEFRNDGRVITTTTTPDGAVDETDETYRVVGSTLIINRPGYLINARYSVSNDQLVVSAEEFSAVLRRLR
ncbi:MAG: glycine zipper domain-containing protein [Phycisphaerales bacterium JB043]